jgi:hypothetical protein
MSNKNSNKILECGICFESLDVKQIDYCTELDCNHIFHDKCLKKWCITCINQDYKPNCPLCRKDIDGEYLEILEINQNQNDINLIVVKNTMNLFQYIISNQLYKNLEELKKIKERYPNEFNNIYYMLEGYCMLNSVDNFLHSIS